MFEYVGQDETEGQSYKSMRDRRVQEDKYTGWLDRQIDGWDGRVGGDLKIG